jgi:hypothetical protein
MAHPGYYESARATMSEQMVLYEVDGKVGIVTLNRPAKLNALSMECGFRRMRPSVPIEGGQ